MTNLLVFTQTHHTTVDIDMSGLRIQGLAPQSARRAAIISDLIPCWVTDGDRVYRVTPLSITEWPVSRLRVREFLTISEWITDNASI